MHPWLATPSARQTTSVGQSRQRISAARNFLHILADPVEPDIDLWCLVLSSRNSIVAVHGLNPWGRKLHAAATWTATAGSLWLRDFLPARLPRARIVMFDYNSNVTFQSSTAGVLEQSQSLLNQLELARAGKPNRPLIFICHSLGGILVKRALISAKQSDVYRSIADHTFGIVFFGTPHGGGKIAETGDLVARIVRRISGRPKNSFMSALRKDSSLANTIANDFRQFLEVFQFQSYYETRPLKYFGIVVDQKAAVLGLPDTRERSIGLDADHYDICKFESQSDPVYRQVEENIARMVNEAVKRFEIGRSIPKVAADKSIN
ncbi:hypothetical protein PFICI_04918 [Pestalotiopsis fici W106-1]|uniref:DUF676 domain-containing protein n=1 Tax=Pestalotiopsis fici (strain W106-1 / CGMCC3.15140) TaxID=1229662 RepID=W3XC70_PESFW|nr:uncharacterized protein PFICI_04918 [Pestalotiopsis fici W106-1]ETS83042.1 hypothetical protein PFICI_04918 [Pestalotiopsis fici W106-1]